MESSLSEFLKVEPVTVDDWEPVENPLVGELVDKQYKYQFDFGSGWVDYNLDMFISNCKFRRKLIPITEYKNGSYKEFYYEDDKTIFGFFEDNRFLSNFHKSWVTYNSITWDTSEHAYMWAKTYPEFNQKDWVDVHDMTAGQVKRWGSKVNVRDDWEQVKLDVMFQILVDKFSDCEMSQLLENTGDKILIEANNWGDKYWGLCVKTNTGSNHLGKILMQIRELNRLEKQLD